MWVRVAALTLGLVAQLPDVTTVNLGGGYKACIGSPPRASLGYGSHTFTHITTINPAPCRREGEELKQKDARGLPRAFTTCSVSLPMTLQVARMALEHGTDLQVIGKPVRDAFVDFYRQYGRALRLEIEPGPQD